MSLITPKGQRHGQSLKCHTLFLSRQRKHTYHMEPSGTHKTLDKEYILGFDTTYKQQTFWPKAHVQRPISSHPSPMLHHQTVSYADVTNKHSLLQWSHKLLQKVVPLFLEFHLFHVDVTCWHCFISPLDTVILAGKPHKLVLNLKIPLETSVLCPHYNQSTPAQVYFSSKLNFIIEYGQMQAQKSSPNWGQPVTHLTWV